MSIYTCTPCPTNKWATYFCDNFGISVVILIIVSLLYSEMNCGKGETKLTTSHQIRCCPYSEFSGTWCTLIFVSRFYGNVDFGHFCRPGSKYCVLVCATFCIFFTVSVLMYFRQQQYFFGHNMSAWCALKWFICQLTRTIFQVLQIVGATFHFISFHFTVIFSMWLCSVDYPCTRKTIVCTCMNLYFNKRRT